jgi:hypothetical protein
VKRRIPSLLGLEPPIIQPVAQRYTTELSRLRKAGYETYKHFWRAGYENYKHLYSNDFSVFSFLESDVISFLKANPTAAYEISPSSYQVKARWPAKGRVVPVGTCGGVGVWLHTFLTSELGRCELSAWRSGRFSRNGGLRWPLDMKFYEILFS